MGNVHGYDIECSNIHGKELFHDAKCCAEWRDNNIETNVSTSLRKRSTMMKKSIVWTKLSIRGILWTQLSLINDPVVIGLQSAKVYVFFRFCAMSRQSFFNILNATKLGKTELQEQEPRGTTAILRTSKESQRNSSGIFSQDSLRCSSVTKSIIC